MEQAAVASDSSTEAATVVDDADLRPWLVLIGGILATTVSAGYVSSFGVYEDIYTRSHAASASNIGWVGSTQLCLIFAVGLPAGKLLDKGYFRQTILAGSLIFLLSLFALSLAHPAKYYQIWLSQGLGMGLGAGLIYAPSVVIQGHHWNQRKSFAMSIVALGNSLGGVVFPIMLNRLLNGSTGFARGVRASAFLCLGLLVISNLLMKDNSAYNPHLRKTSGHDILTDYPFWIFTIGLLCLTCALFFPYFYLELFAINNDIPPYIAFYLIAVLNAGGIIGRIAAGLLSHHFGPFNVIVVALLCTTGLMFGLFGIETVASSMAFAVLYGIFSGTGVARLAST
ncbi:hypothetical protein ONZ45_g6114 [Pleurotus djamor]|nr:hypothetical protein ONZ45_g6114 [Pleurotus djamor]